MIGLRPEAVGLQIELAEEWLKREEVLLSLPEGHLTYGLSPHAPYSVSPELLRRSIELAKRFDAPVAMHLAETRDELEFLADGRGAFVEMLKSFGAWPDGGLPTGRRPLDILRVLANAPRALVVHGNYLADDEIEFIAARPQMSVVLPAHARILRARAASVATLVGEGSQRRARHRWAWIEPGPQLVERVDLSARTISGCLAEPIAGARHAGGSAHWAASTIAERSRPGKRADLVAVALGGRGDPLEALLTTGSQIVRTVCGGELG